MNKALNNIIKGLIRLFDFLPLVLIMLHLLNFLLGQNDLIQFFINFSYRQNNIKNIYLGIKIKRYFYFLHGFSFFHNH